LDEADQKYIGFTLDAPNDGFQIEGGKGYIVNVPEGGMVAFTGAAWTRPLMPAAPAAQPDGTREHRREADVTWAFVVSGRLSPFAAVYPACGGKPRLSHPKALWDDSDDSLKKDGYLVTVRNTRTNTVVTDTVRSGYFAPAFVDLKRKNVVRRGDRLAIQLRDREGGMVSDVIYYEVTAEAIRQAFLPITLRNVDIPRHSLMLQNYPNPFNPETWIPYQLRESAEVIIRIYDAMGQLVRTLNLGQRAAGFYLGRTRAAYWDGHNNTGEKVASGIYLYQIKAGNFDSSTRKMVMVK
jgi:hypothetical protein